MKTKKKKYDYQDTINEVQSIMLGRQIIKGFNEKKVE